MIAYQIHCNTVNILGNQNLIQEGNKSFVSERRESSVFRFFGFLCV